MKIKKIILENFRNFGDRTEINFDDLTVIIGRNDIGKSSVLEAIDIFINDKNSIVKLDSEDSCKRSSSDEIKIGMVFADFPSTVDIDEGNETSLSDEYLLNKDGLLEIYKSYKNGKQTGVFIRAQHPSGEDVKDLLLKKQPELKKIVEQNSLVCKNKTKNALLRKAIRDSYSSLELEELDIPANEEDAKRIWLKLENYLPIYSLFQSDRPNKDGDSEVQEPMKLAIKEILKDNDLQEKLREVAQQVESASKDIAKKTLEKLAEMNSEIAQELNPIIPSADELKWESVFKNIEISSDNGVPLNKRGSGVRRLVLLNFFRARAEESKNKTSKTHIVYAIEEPETSQHPNHQKILLEALKELASQDGRQIFITTHSPSVVQLLPIDSIRMLKKDTNGLVICDGVLAISDIIQDLGVLPQVGRLAVFVEGETDRDFLMNIGENIDELKSIFDISTISIIPLGGSVLERWINRNYLDGSNIVEFHLYDKDADQKYKSAIEKVNSRASSSKGYLTNKLEIENYIHPSLIEGCSKFSNIDCSRIRTNWNNEDICQYVLNNVAIYNTSSLQGEALKVANIKYEKQIKSIMSGHLAKHMTKTLFQEIDAWDEVENWFKELRQLSNSSRD